VTRWQCTAAVAEAQAEARILMLSTNNILKPADGRPVTMPTQDMIIGIYFLTMLKEARWAKAGVQLGGRGDHGLRPQGAVAAGQGHVAAERVRRTGRRDRAAGWRLRAGDDAGPGTVQRGAPADYPFVDVEVGKKQLGGIVNDLAERYTKVEVANALDNLKDLGFRWATRSGVTVSIDDSARRVQAGDHGPVRVPGREGPEAVRAGLITSSERRQELIEIWTGANAEVGKAMEETSPRTTRSG